MTGLNFYSQFSGNLGIPNHAREFAIALSKKIDLLNLVQIAEQPLRLNEQPLDVKRLFKKPDFNLPNLTFWYPNSYMDYCVSSTRNIGYYIFEYEIIPKFFIESINELDAICTASKWGANVLKNNGVTIPIYVIPGGINPDKFNNKKRKIEKSGIFKFLHIGKYENRKGTEQLIRCFNEAFKGDPSIRLTLFADNIYDKSKSTVEDKIKTLSYELRYPTSNIDVKHFVKDLKEYYDTHHCAVFPTKGEGIGLPIVEAMACGVPTIATLNTGTTEFLTKDNSILLDKTIPVDVYDELFFPNAGLFGKWNSPTDDQLIEKMLWAYQNRNIIEEIGVNSANYMVNNFTWDHSADKFVQEGLCEA